MICCVSSRKLLIWRTCHTMDMEIFFIWVSSSVWNQWELFQAILTFIWLFFSVDSFMFSKFSWISERFFCNQFTGKVFVNSDVCLQVRYRWKQFLTIIVLVRVAPEWICLCCFKPLDSENAFPHWSQLKGFSPECILIIFIMDIFVTL